MKMKSLLLLSIMVLLTSCASHRTAKISDTMAMKKTASDQGAEQAERIAPKEEFAGLDTKQFYSMTVKNAEIKDALLLLSRKTGMTIVTDRDVTGRVTADLKNMTLKDILYVLLKPYGYTVYVEQGLIRVSKPRLITRTFFVNYIKDKRSSNSTMSAAISESGSSGYNQGGTSINLNVSSGGASGGSSSGSTSGQQGSVSVQTSSVSDYWNEVIKGLEVIVFGDSSRSSKTEGYSKGDKSGKQLIVNELAGIVYVRDYSDNMENVKSFLDDVERNVKRQVLIQAHIAEVALNDTFSFGLNWNYLLTNRIGSDVKPIQFSQNLVPSVQSNVFQMSISNNKVSALLDAMREQGNLNMLSSPKISTLNNQKAVIKLTTKEVSWLMNSAYNAQGNVLLSYTTPQIDEVGIFLDVTPQINEKGSITMQIHPSISEKTRTSISPDGKSSKPIIDIREVDTMIDVKNNQTVVIAGLIVDKIIETKKSVPFLGDIPFIGNLFSYISQDKKKTELVILITPYILNDKSIADIRVEHEERLKNAAKKFIPTP